MVDPLLVLLVLGSIISQLSELDCWGVFPWALPGAGVFRAFGPL